MEKAQTDKLQMERVQTERNRAPTIKMTPKTFAITGANGYVGSCISEYIAKKGMPVLKLGRKPSKDTVFFEFGALPQLSQSASAIFKDVDFLIHCAWDFSKIKFEDSQKINVEGSLLLFRAARDAGVKKIILISTMSAFEGCTSDYGKAKLEIEKRVMAEGMSNVYFVRPGLVYGKNAKSVMGKLAILIRKLPVIPLLDTGVNTQLLYTCHNEDLGELIYRVCISEMFPPLTPITAANSNGFTLRQLLTKMAQAIGRPAPSFFSVPYSLLHTILGISEKIGLRIFRSDSLVSLMNLDPKPDFSAIGEDKMKFREFEPGVINPN